MGRPAVVPRRPFERPRDDPADRLLADEQLARERAGVIELPQRHRLLVCRDLKDRIRRRVDDPLTRPLMLGAELIDDRGTGCGFVAKPPASGALRELVQEWNRKSLGIGLKCLL